MAAQEEHPRHRPPYGLSDALPLKHGYLVYTQSSHEIPVSSKPPRAFEGSRGWSNIRGADGILGMSRLLGVISFLVSLTTAPVWGQNPELLRFPSSGVFLEPPPTS